jgi:hypothetical protein
VLYMFLYVDVYIYGSLLCVCVRVFVCACVCVRMRMCRRICVRMRMCMLELRSPPLARGEGI